MRGAAPLKTFLHEETRSNSSTKPTEEKLSDDLDHPSRLSILSIRHESRFNENMMYLIDPERPRNFYGAGLIQCLIR